MLEINNLCAGYDRTEKLRGVSTRFCSSCLTAIIGPNGCGKTTLLKCAAGLLKPFSGELLLDGEDYFSLSSKEIARRVSYMPQSRAVPSISVRRLAEHGRYPYLNFGRELRQVDRDSVKEALRRAGMVDKANISVSHLSGGERQRAYIAMMLAQQAGVMLLDEPTTYLDPAAQFALMGLLTSLALEGRAVVAVLHDLGLAMRYADRVILMQDGKILMDGTPEALYKSGLLGRVFRIRVEKIREKTYIFTNQEEEI